MHYHCEIIVPAWTQDIEAAVKSVMAQFDNEEYSNKNSFWDWFVIGGRFAGSKQVAQYDKEKQDAFNKDGDTTIAGDISDLCDSLTVKCCRVIFAGLSYDGKKLEAKFMLSDAIWNGVNHMDVKWDGTIQDALHQWNEKLANYSEEAKENYSPKGDWLCVTVDYHG